MYLFDEDKTERAQERLTDLLDTTGRAPVVEPLGLDADKIFHFHVVTVKEDDAISEHITSFKRLPDGRLLAGCICQAGTGDLHCYHVAETVPRFYTYELVYRTLESFRGRGFPNYVGHLKAVS